MGQTILKVWRRGKYVCISLENKKCLTIHLGMSGILLFNANRLCHRHIRLSLILNQNCTLDFIDMRKFGKSRIWQCEKELLTHLGTEPVNSKNVHQILRKLKTSRPIKSVLLDQQIIAGIGNIYADESLFRSGIHPLSPTCGIDPTKIKRLSRIIPQVLEEAIKNMGTTIAQYRPPDRSRGQNQRFLKVYGLTGTACSRCGTRIERIRINQRSSHFCPRCQPLQKMDLR